MTACLTNRLKKHKNNAEVAELFYKEQGFEDKIKHGEHKDGKINLNVSEMIK